MNTKLKLYKEQDINAQVIMAGLKTNLTTLPKRVVKKRGIDRALEDIAAGRIYVAHVPEHLKNNRYKRLLMN